MPVGEQILRLAVHFWVPVFAGTTEGVGAQIHDAGKCRHHGVIPEAQILTRNECS
jgi:hypothetical protein